MSKIKFLSGTEERYNALSEKEANTFYKTENNLYLGESKITNQVPNGVLIGKFDSSFEPVNVPKNNADLLGGHPPEYFASTQNLTNLDIATTGSYLAKSGEDVINLLCTYQTVIQQDVSDCINQVNDVDFTKYQARYTRIGSDMYSASVFLRSNVRQFQIYYGNNASGTFTGWVKEYDFINLNEKINNKFDNAAIEVSVTVNPEIYDIGHVYTVNDEIISSYGHPFDSSPTRITYFALGNPANQLDYKIIIGITDDGRIFKKVQNIYENWTEWTELIDNKNISNIIPKIASNENLLVNSDFRNVVNQRGQTDYPGSNTFTYSIDRWCIQNGAVYIKDGYIELHRTGNPICFKQIIGENLVGQTVTFSVCTDSDTIFSNTQYISGEPFDSYDTDTLIENGYKIDLTYENGKLSTRIFHDGDDDSAIIGLKWAKLEIGTVTTAYIPPNHAIELLKCKSYYQEITGQFISDSINDNFIYTRIKFTPSARISNPTGKFKNEEFNTIAGVHMYAINNRVMQNGFTFSISFTESDTVEIRAEKANHGLNGTTTGTFLQIGNDCPLIIDAEIYP